MNSSEREKSGAEDPRSYFAAERTLLAWVRTGLAMMGFGFVVARFGLFLRELASEAVVPQERFSFSLWVGTTLVLLGVVVSLVAAARHWQTVGRLNRGEPLRFGSVSLGVVVAVVLGLLGLAIAAYLTFGLSAADQAG